MMRFSLITYVCSCALVCIALEGFVQGQEENSSAPGGEGGVQAQPQPTEGVASETPATPEPAKMQEEQAPAAADSRQPASAPTPLKTPKPPQKMVSMTFTEPIEIKRFLEIVSAATGKQFLYDDAAIQGKIMLLTPTQIPEDQVFSLLESMLEYREYAMVPSPGGFIKVVPRVAAGRRPMPLLFPEELEKMPDSDAAVTVVYQLKYINVPEVQTTVAPLVAQGAIIVLPRANVLFITDYLANLKRIARLIKLVDNEDTLPKLRIFPLQHARAEFLARQVATIVRAEAAGGGAPQQMQATVEFDATSNRLIVVATETTMKRIEKLVESLDVEPPESASTRRIYRLKNTKAEEVANTLQQLAQQTPMGVRTVPGAVQPGMPQVSPGAPGAFSIGELRIIADKNSNSIIVFGPGDAQDEIKGLLDELDRRKPQVKIEAVVVQVSGGDTLDIGTELASWNGDSNPGGVGMSAFGFSTYDYATGERTVLGGGGGGGDVSVAEGITGYWLHNNQIPILMRALLTDRAGKIISRPVILANDNNEATFKSQDAAPYTTLSTVTSTQTSTSFGGYAEAGTTLKITPHISEGDYLSLEIELEVSQFTASSVTAGVPPPKRLDTLKTAVTVPDKYTIVIGGLSGVHTTTTVKGIPVLSKIPILGLLFSRKIETRDDTTEYIFIKAHIARDEAFEDLLGMSKEAKQESDKLEKEIKGKEVPEGDESGGK